MKKVCKYNLCKGVSTLLTVGTPIVTLLCYGDMFVHNSGTSISAAGMFAILFAALFLKDKIVEEFKMPPTFVLCVIILLLICLIESILVPIKSMCIATAIATCGDEFTFKQMYKNVEAFLPESTKIYKKFGFIFTTSKKLLGE